MMQIAFSKFEASKSSYSYFFWLWFSSLTVGSKL